MKTDGSKVNLLKKISQKQLLFGLIIVLLSLIGLYFLTRYYIIAETHEGLNNISYIIEQELEKNEAPKSLYPLFEVKEVAEIKPNVIKDTIIFDELQNESELFKELKKYKTIHGKNYLIVTRSLMVEYDDTLLSILLAFAIIISLVYMAQYYFNKQINKTVWSPFFKNLEAIKTFSIQSKKPIELVNSNVLEFSELNGQIKSLTEKVASDYQNLKQFTEDLSHEVQTPLSIIQAKIENLINETQYLSNENLSTLNDIQNNTKRLSKLNKGLILLTKIDNQQFNNPETVNISSIITTLIEDVEELSNIKQQSIQFSKNSTIQLSMDKVLAEVLFSNLIGNAVKYTSKNGQIKITINDNTFTISNSGEHPISNPEQLFNRFYKENNKSQSLGLGLAIVKKICDYYGFSVQYTFNEKQHEYSVSFHSLTKL